MPSQASRSLTERQRAVMERIDRRVPIKVIAQDLGVSETRINQHIRALKDIYQAESLGELVERHRIDEDDVAANPSAANDGSDNEREAPGSAAPIAGPAGSEAAAAAQFGDRIAARAGLSEAEYNKNQVPGRADSGDQGARTDPGELALSDVLPLIEQAPWLVAGEPQVVPRVLDGEHALWFRFAAIVGIAFGFLAAVVLTLTAAITISETLDGRAAVPVDQQGFS